VFLKFFGNENEFTKHLFEARLRTPLTPTFTFWRQGRHLRYAFQVSTQVS
jgi:hypothetical protein